MSSSRSTLTAFTDAAADAVARAIAEVQREAAREREVREAQFAAAMALLEARIASVAETEKRLADRLESLKDGEPGCSVTVEEVEPIIAREVEARLAEWPKPKDGDSVTLDDVIPMIEEKLRAAVEALPPVEAKEVDPEVLHRMVQDAVSALPPAEPGKDADPELVAALVEEKLRAAVEALPPPEKGDPGPVGSLPVVREWEDRVYYQGEVVSFEGSLFQATKDTGKSPEHEDWVCIVAKGKDGNDGKSPKFRGTYDPDQTYSALDVVALNGASFVARSDDPGPCPGEGWQLMATQGKQGKPGLPGKPGTPGIAVTAALKAVTVSEEGLMIFRNADGTEVQCDLYSLLSKIGK